MKFQNNINEAQNNSNMNPQHFNDVGSGSGE